ncbi:hypothetical protein GUJ93_ZPchr0015g6787 [Zizania palustris]|uniref:Uncharacterized protein n=1 Tax=Zizania palustris TaxID=103762 RepID=A0A8J5THB5_ZIZPA|nr:hypothetical protein GUJ93_ZPchr0015g6787 [Zizania palustris]
MAQLHDCQTDAPSVYTYFLLQIAAAHTFLQIVWSRTSLRRTVAAARSHSARPRTPPARLLLPGCRPARLQWAFLVQQKEHKKNINLAQENGITCTHVSNNLTMTYQRTAWALMLFGARIPSRLPPPHGDQSQKPPAIRSGTVV